MVFCIHLNTIILDQELATEEIWKLNPSQAFQCLKQCRRIFLQVPIQPPPLPFNDPAQHPDYPVLFVPALGLGALKLARLHL